MLPCGPGPVFGPMPNPDGIKWVITRARFKLIYPDVEFICTTDVPIYLHAQVGCRPPWKIPGEHFKRGIVMHHDPEVIFPFRQSFCQKEHGMTLEHTIVFPCYPDCTVHWWRCLGRDTGLFAKWGASSSGFYNIVCEAPPPPTPFCTCDCDPDNHRTYNASHCFSQTFRPSTNFRVTHLGICCSAWGIRPTFPQTRLEIRKPTIYNCPGSYLIASAILDTSSIPDSPPSILTGTCNPFTIFADTDYCFCVIPVPWKEHPCAEHLQWHVGIGQTCALGDQLCNNWYNDPGWEQIAGVPVYSMYLGGYIPA